MIVPYRNVPFSISTDQVRDCFHMNEATYRMIWVPFENRFFRYFFDFKVLARLTVFEIKLKWVLIHHNIPHIYFALTVSNIQMAKRSAKSSWEFDVLFTELSKWIVLISTEVIRDGFARQYHEDVSGIFYVEDVQYWTDYFDGRWSLIFYVKTREIPYFYLFCTGCHQVSALVLINFLDLSWVNIRLSDKYACWKFPKINITVLAASKQNILVLRKRHKSYHINSADLVYRFLTVSAPNCDKSFVIERCQELICVWVVCQRLWHWGFWMVLCKNSCCFWVK